MKVGDIKFEQVWLGKAVRPEPGDGGTAFELLGRTRAGGYYRMAMPEVQGDEIIRERVSSLLLESWFQKHGYEFPGWVREEVLQGRKLLMDAGWDEDVEKEKIKRAQENWPEEELRKLEEEFLEILAKPWE